MDIIIKREPYMKPTLVGLANLKEITFACEGWSCSITVPPPS